MGDPGPLQLLVGPGKALSPVTRLHHCTHPLLDSAAVHLHTPSLTSITSLHRHVPILRESSHGSAHQQPVCPQLAPTRTPSVCSYHYMYVCNQPQPLYRPLAASPHSQVYAHHQLWPPLLSALIPRHWTW